MVRIFQLCLTTILLAACDPIVDNRGFVNENVDTSDLVTGIHERADVVRVMGSPSAVSQYNDAEWYYIHVRKETTAFFKPEITDQSVTKVLFDEKGYLKEIQKVEDLEPLEVEYVNKETPTEGHSLGFFEQILGNVGRFGAPGSR